MDRWTKGHAFLSGRAGPGHGGSRWPHLNPAVARGYGMEGGMAPRCRGPHRHVPPLDFFPLSKRVIPHSRSWNANVFRLSRNPKHETVHIPEHTFPARSAPLLGK